MLRPELQMWTCYWRGVSDCQVAYRRLYVELTSLAAVQATLCYLLLGLLQHWALSMCGHSWESSSLQPSLEML